MSGDYEMTMHARQELYVHALSSDAIEQVINSGTVVKVERRRLGCTCYTFKRRDIIVAVDVSKTEIVVVTVGRE